MDVTLLPVKTRIALKTKQEERPARA